MSGLKQQIKKKAITSYEWSPPQKAVKLSDVLGLFVVFKERNVCVPRKQLEELIETMPKPLDKKYEYRDVNGLKQIRLYDFLPNLREWKTKLKELLGVEKTK